MVCQEEDRLPLDLILVLDVSGSMQGEKLQLVKNTTRLVVSQLTPHDRLAVVTFNGAGTRLTPLMAMSDSGKLLLMQHVDGVRASGGTNVSTGLHLALRLLRERTHRNAVSTVLLLSDGCDGGGGLTACTPITQSLRTECGACVHTFGFGSDHDPALMNGIAEVGSGSFTFVERLESVAESFSACLGAVTDVVGQQVVLTVSGAHGCTITRVSTPYAITSSGDAVGTRSVALGEVRHRCVASSQTTPPRALKCL